MTQLDLLALLDEGVQNGRITPHLLTYITAELHNRSQDAAPDDQDVQEALTPADRKGSQGVSTD
jgi:hypothetical protein